jgi:hypothetical protein
MDAENVFKNAENAKVLKIDSKPIIVPQTCDLPDIGFCPPLRSNCC